jgi:hypothetical protein
LEMKTIPQWNFCVFMKFSKLTIVSAERYYSGTLLLAGTPAFRNDVKDV